MCILESAFVGVVHLGFSSSHYKKNVLGKDALYMICARINDGRKIRQKGTIGGGGGTERKKKKKIEHFQELHVLIL